MFPAALQDMLAILGTFRKQWSALVEQFDKLGKHIEQVRDAYSTLTGTRARVLQSKINAVNRLREQEGVPMPQKALGAGEPEPDLAEDLASADGNLTWRLEATGSQAAKRKLGGEECVRDEASTTTRWTPPWSRISTICCWTLPTRP